MSGGDQVEVLRTDEGRYRLLVDAITDYAIYMLDPSGVVTSWNAGAQRFKGYTAPEILGQHFSRFYTEEDRAAGLPATALRIAAQEGRLEREGWRVRKNGERFWAHVIIDPIRSPAGDLMGFAKITRDLTERKVAEEALKRSEQQFRLLVQGVTDYAIFMLDPTGHVASWNPGAERIKGYSPSEILGEHFSRFYLPEDVEQGLPQLGLDTAARTGRFEKEGWRVRKDGSRFWAHVVIDAIRNDMGDVVGFAKVTRDVTERMEAQRALEEARAALFQAQKMEALGQLTGGVAHDFNNLLMAILGSLELLRKRLPRDPKMSALVENAIRGAERGAALTQRMLAFARRQELKPEAVHLEALIGGMMGLLERSLGPMIELETRFEPDLPPVLTDGAQLEAALLNLAVNARDAMPEGGRIVIEGQVPGPGQFPVGLEPGSYVRLAVTDTGPGMDADTLARATEPFFTTKEVGKGTGLGLSMVHGLAEQSGGRLRLTSPPGEGLTAELWLPVASATMGDSDEDEAQDSGLSLSGLTVLTVDDDPLVQTNTVGMMEDLGCRVLAAKSGAEALALLHGEAAVDLVITDVAMPHMTGVQLAQVIRKQSPSLPILLTSGYADVRRDGDTGLPRLSKPFSQRQLARAILQAAGRVRSVTPAS